MFLSLVFPGLRRGNYGMHSQLESVGERREEKEGKP